MKKLFELKKDISTPNRYIRAGEKRTKEEWEIEFPNALSLENREWFIDLSDEKYKQEVEKDIAQEVVYDIFEKNGLYSITYKQAAVIAIGEYVKRTTKN